MTYITQNDAVTLDYANRSKDTVAEPKLLDINRMLMGNGTRMNYHQLTETPTPNGTATHLPVPHSTVVTMMRHHANDKGLRIIQEAHLTDHDDKRYFGLFQVAGGHGEYSTIIGLRNSHDKSIPIGICIGNAPFVCSNLCFDNQFVAKARHTINVYSTIHERISELLDKAIDSQTDTHRRIERMKNQFVNRSRGDSFIWDCVQDNIITLKQGLDTRKQWYEPEHNEFSASNAWSLQNAFTNVLRNERNRHTHLERTTMLRKAIDKAWDFDASNIYS